MFKKKKNKKIAIIGGGSTGCMAAKMAASKGFDVSLYEFTNRLGGILSDLKFKNEKFLNGCQYLKQDCLWLKDSVLAKKVEKTIKKFVVKYGSYTHFDDKPHAEKYFPEITLIKTLNNFNLNCKEKNSLLDRLESYPKQISQNLKRWIKRFDLDPKQLQWSSASNGLMLARVYLQRHYKEIKDYKKNDILADELYGLPKKELNLKYIKVALPKKGYDKFFKYVYEDLIDRNVKVLLKKPIRPVWNKNNLTIFSGNDKIDCDYIVWTCNPTRLVKNYDQSTLQSKNIKVRLYCFIINKNIKSYFYAHVFSNKTSIFRIFLYRLNNKCKVTVECFDEDEDLKKIIKNIKLILKKFNFDLKLSEINFKMLIKQKRYFLVSILDEKILKSFQKNIKDGNLICGPWTQYNRDTKIEYLQKKINDLNNLIN